MTELITSLPVDKTKAADSPTPIAAKETHTEVFSDPHEYLSIIRKNFAQLSHGHDKLNLSDLKVDAEDSSLDPKVRSAAQIAYKHYDALLSIASQSPDHETIKYDALTGEDLKFASHMVDGEVFKESFKHEIGQISAGAFFTVFGVGEVAAGGLIATTLAEKGSLKAGALVGGSIMLEGVVGTCLGLSQTWKGLSAYHRYTGYSRDDKELISRWLRD